MEESLAPEHGGELLRDALEQLLDGCAVADEGGRHFEAPGRDVAHGNLDVVRDPLDEVAGVLVLHLCHLLVDLLHGHASPEDGGDGEVAAVARVTRGHHVLGVEHLLGQLGHGECSVLLAAARGQRSESRHEEVQTREGHHVHGQLPEVGVQLAGEPQTCRDTGHAQGDEVVQVTVRRVCELERAEADVVECFVVDAERLVSVLDELMHGQSCVVWLDYGIRHLRRWHDGIRVHDPVWIFLPDLGDQEGAHAGAGAASEAVGQLEALQAVAALGLLPDDVEDAVHQLGAFCVVALGPVVTGARLAEHEVIRLEKLPEWSRSHGVHRARLEVDQDAARDVLPAAGFVVVNVDALELEVRVAMVGAGRVDSVLIGYDFPELPDRGQMSEVRIRRLEIS